MKNLQNLIRPYRNQPIYYFYQWNKVNQVMIMCQKTSQFHLFEEELVE